MKMFPAHMTTLAALAVLAAGCAAPATQQQQQQQAYQPTWHNFVTNQGENIAASGWYEQPFDLPLSGTVHYDFMERENGGVDVCVLAQNEESYWENNQQVQGWACHQKLNRGGDDAGPLLPGRYALAFRCTNYVDTCVITYNLRAYY